MAKVQVNVRPAKRIRQDGCSQRGGQSGEFYTDLKRQSFTDPRVINTNGSSEITHSQNSEPHIQTENLPVWQEYVWKLVPGTPIGRAVVSATQRLSDIGSLTANLDAQLILAHVLGVERSWLFAHYDHELSILQANTFTEHIARRSAGEPIAYLVGRKEFYGIELQVDRRVLIPRPETELLVDAVLTHLEMMPTAHSRIADVGTGSGAIATALAYSWPTARIYAIDVSRDALDVAKANFEQFDQRQQISPLHGDLLEPLPEPVDVIVANLPYINSKEYPLLMADVRDYEPELALHGGDDGLDVIRRLLQQAPSNLRPDGRIMLEIGCDQGEEMLGLVNTILPNARNVSVRSDYNGHDRIVIIQL